jgi:uncharacterized protein YkwD
MPARCLFRRSALVTVLVAVLVGCLASPAVITRASAGTNYHFKRRERCFMRKINRVRARHGLRRLYRDKQLGYVGRLHARDMAYYASVWDDSYIGQRVTHWRSLGTNAGRGRRCRQLTRAFLNSWPHRANILGHYRYMGVGVAWSNGNIYVSENFESRINPGNIYRWP